MLFLQYPKCSTCRKAKAWLDLNNITYDNRHIVDDKPTYEELKNWSSKTNLPLNKFFNTCGVKYKELKLKDKLPSMTDEEKLQLLSTDGKLIKRPIIVDENNVLIGFNEEKWKDHFNL